MVRSQLNSLEGGGFCLFLIQASSLGLSSVVGLMRLMGEETGSGVVTGLGGR